MWPLILQQDNQDLLSGQNQKKSKKKSGSRQNLLRSRLIASTTFYWSKQVTRSVQIQEIGKYTSYWERLKVILQRAGMQREVNYMAILAINPPHQPRGLWNSPSVLCVLVISRKQKIDHAFGQRTFSKSPCAHPQPGEDAQPPTCLVHLGFRGSCLLTRRQRD